MTVTGTQNLCARAREITLGTALVGDTGTDSVENSLDDCGAMNRDVPDTFFRFVAPEGKIYTGKKRNKKKKRNPFFS